MDPGPLCKDSPKDLSVIRTPPGSERRGAAPENMGHMRGSEGPADYQVSTARTFGGPEWP
jgi:hypothetical protein